MSLPENAVKKSILAVLLTFMIIISYSQMIKYRVDQKKCITCGYCCETKVCPVNAIHIHFGKAVIDRETCIGCKLCQVGNQLNYKGCPVGAFGPESTSSPVIHKAPVQDTSPDVTKTSANIKVVINQGVKVNSDSNSTIKPMSITGIAPAKKQVKNTAPIKQNAIEQPQDFDYKVDPSICIGCQLCVSHCPVGAIQFIDNKALIDLSKCIHCGICRNGNNDDFAGCPVKAISKKARVNRE